MTVLHGGEGVARRRLTGLYNIGHIGVTGVRGKTCGIDVSVLSGMASTLNFIVSVGISDSIYPARFSRHGPMGLMVKGSCCIDFNGGRTREYGLISVPRVCRNREVGVRAPAPEKSVARVLFTSRVKAAPSRTMVGRMAVWGRWGKKDTDSPFVRVAFTAAVYDRNSFLICRNFCAPSFVETVRGFGNFF